LKFDGPRTGATTHYYT